MKKLLVLFSLFFLVSSVSAQITMSLGDVVGETGSNVTVPLDVTNFNDVGAISLKISYDSSILTFVEIQNAPASFINNAANGVLTIAWFDLTATNPLNLGNSTLVDIVFNYNGNNSPVSFLVSQCEVSNSQGTPLSVTYNDGSVSGGTPPAINPPNLLTPSNGATNISLSPNFDWSDVSGATSYHFQLSTSGGFGSTIVNESSLTSSNYSFSGTLTGNTEYFWRVRASNGTETSNWSTIFSFRTIPAGTGDLIVEIGSSTVPPSSQVVIPLEVTNFNNVGAISLKINYNTANLTFVRIENTSLSFVANQVADGLVLAWFDISGANPLNFGNGTLADLVFNYTSGTQNLSVNESESEITDGSGAALDVTYIDGTITQGNPLPNPPVLTAPQDGTTNAATEPTLIWQVVTDVISYNIQIATEASFNNIVVDESGITSTQYEVAEGVLDYGTTYYWRVSSTSAAGTGNFSLPFSFTTILEPLSVPVLNSPADGAVDQSLELNFDWNDVADATHYIFVIAEDDGFTNITIQVESVTSSNYTATAGTLDYSTTYYWRVMATDGTRFSDWSDVRSFTTVAEELGIPILIAPGNGSEGLGLTPTLDWSDVNGATSYSLQLSTDNGFQNLVVDGANLPASNYSVPSGILANNTTYYWHVKANDNEGSSEWSTAWSFKTLSTGVEVYQSGIPEEFQLNQNYPNPFNPTTKIRYSLPEQSSVTVSVYNMIGQFIGNLVNTDQSAGYYEVNFDAAGLTSGTYIYKLQAIGESGKEFSDIRKMLLVK